MSPRGRTNRIETADRLHSAAIHFLRSVARADSLSGQGPARLSALSVLVFGGAKTLSELAAAERVKAPTMSRIVAGLKRSGLAVVVADKADARRVRIRVTPKGEKLLQEARRRRIAAVAEMFAGLDESDVKLLRKSALVIEKMLQPRGTQKFDRTR